MSFELLGERVKSCINEKGFQETPIQKQAIPEIISGRHVLAIAPTGTGKTEAAILPVLSRITEQKVKGQGIYALYITPLRALNRNMLERITWWGEQLGITVGVRHGDTPQSQRTKQIRAPPAFLITTPETLGSLLAAPKMSKNLETVKYVIIDEVHELAEEKRGVQLSVALERLVQKAGEFQRIGLSATVGNPEEVAKIFFGARDHKIIRTDIGRKMEIHVESPSMKKQDEELSERLMMPPDTVARIRRLKELVDKHKSVLTFVNTRHTAEIISSRFAAWDEAHDIGVHHSSLSKDVRVVAEQKFKAGELKGLIATSSLELGIDIGHIDLVVQYMSPRQVSRLVQRVGRSGHTVTTYPKGVILTVDPEDTLEAAVIAKRAVEGSLEEPRFFDKPYDVLAHQIAGLALENKRMKITDAYAIVKRAHPFKDLSLQEFTDVLNQLASEWIIWTENGEFGKKKGTLLYYYFNLSMIPDEKRFFVKNVMGNKNIGVLDESFVASNLKPRSIFITKGQPWRVLDITEREVWVEPVGDISGEIPAWEGEQIPVPFEIAQDVASLYTKKPVGYYLSKEAQDRAEAFIKKQKKCFTPSPKKITFEEIDNFVIVNAYFGSLANETLGKVLSILISAYTGHTVGVKADPYRIVFEFPSKPRKDLVEQFLMETEPEKIETVLDRSLLRTPLFRFKFIHVAKRFGLIGKEADYQKISVRRLIEAVLDSPLYYETLKEIKKEKLDIPKARQLLEDIQKGKITLETYKGEVSPLAAHAINRVLRIPELVSPARPDSQLIDILKKKVYESTVKLYCEYCGEVFYSKIADLPDKIDCPKCKSNRVAYVKQERDSYELLKKHKEKKKMTPEEKRKMNEYLRTADFISAYGKRAVIVLSGKGIGPEIARRVLGRLRATEERVFKDMLEAQRDYYRTKRYWT